MQHTDCNCSRNQFLVGSRERQARQLKHSQRPSEDCWSRLGDMRRNAFKPVNTLRPEDTIYLLDETDIEVTYKILFLLSVTEIVSLSSVSKKFRFIFNDFHEVISEKIYLYIWKLNFPGQIGFSDPTNHLDVTYDDQKQIFREVDFDPELFYETRITIEWNHCNALPPFLRKGQIPFCSALATSHRDGCTDEYCDTCGILNDADSREDCHCNCPHCTGSESTVKQLREIKAQGCPQCHKPFSSQPLHTVDDYGFLVDHYGFCVNCKNFVNTESSIGFGVFTCSQCPLPKTFQSGNRKTYPIQFCSACWNGFNPDFEDRRLFLNQDTFELEFNSVSKDIFKKEISNLKMSGLLSQMKQHFVLFRWERLLRGFCDKRQIRFW